MKILLLLALVAAPAQTALLHDAMGAFERGEAEPFAPEETAVFEEFGFEEGEQAEYTTADGKSVVVRALQFYDDTGAFAAYHWMKPAAATVVIRGERAVQKGSYTLIHFGNYLMEFDGDLPEGEDIEVGLAYLPRPQLTTDPPVLKYVPEDALVKDSARYILGPATLEKLTPGLPPSTVGFHFGTEGHFGKYQTPQGELDLIIFSYPSSQIARGQIESFHQTEGVIAKRDGPLIATLVDPAAPDEAQRLLARIRYKADVTMNHQPAKRHDSLKNIVLDSFLLCGILAALMVCGGLLVAGTRRLAGKFAPESILAPESGTVMQRLDIDRPGATKSRF